MMISGQEQVCQPPVNNKVKNMQEHQIMYLLLFMLVIRRKSGVDTKKKKQTPSTNQNKNIIEKQCREGSLFPTLHNPFKVKKACHSHLPVN